MDPNDMQDYVEAQNMEMVQDMGEDYGEYDEEEMYYEPQTEEEMQ